MTTLIERLRAVLHRVSLVGHQTGCALESGKPQCTCDCDTMRATLHESIAALEAAERERVLFEGYTIEISRTLFDAGQVCAALNQKTEALQRENEALRASIGADPPVELLNSMAMRYRHDFGLLDTAMQEAIRDTMRKLYDEVTGRGFYHAGWKLSQFAAPTGGGNG